MDKWFRRMLVERFLSWSVYWESHLMDVPRVLHRLFHRTFPVANYRSLSSPQETEENLPLILGIHSQVLPQRDRWTISCPKERTIVH